MDLANIIIATCAAIGTIVSIVTILGKQFREVRADLRQLDTRLSRMEGYIQGRDYKSTGTDHK